MRIRFLFITVFVLLLNACGTSSAFKPVENSNNEWGVSESIPKILQDSEDRLGYLWVFEDVLIRRFISDDDGVQYLVRSELDGSNPQRIEDKELTGSSETPYMLGSTGSRPYVAFFANGDIRFRTCSKRLENCSSISTINRRKLLKMPRASIVEPGANTLTAIWLDWIASNGVIRTSVSTDGGKNWESENDLVDGVERVQLDSLDVVVDDQNRIHAVWVGIGTSETLIDVFYSNSDDNGRNWSEIKKLNDDEKPVWQILPRIEVVGGKIIVAFSDFRDDGPFNDRDWNIYYTTSDDGGATWAKNLRLNQNTRSRQGHARLFKDRNGNLFAFYLSAENSIFLQVVMSEFDPRTGRWSEGVVLTPKSQRPTLTLPHVVPYQNGFIVTQPSINYEKGKPIKYRTTFVSKNGNSLRDTESSSAVKKIQPRKVSVSTQVFEDGFDGISADKWDKSEGVWQVRNGAYVGRVLKSVSDADIDSRYVSYARLKEPENYVLSGRFRLDEITHRTASIYFRSKGDSSYVIQNQFRIGSWAAFESGVDMESRSYKEYSSQPKSDLAQHPFSFRSSRWYRFRVVVSGDQVDYFVDDLHLFSFKIDEKVGPGRIGVGGMPAGPTEFDDISVNLIE